MKTFYSRSEILSFLRKSEDLLPEVFDKLVEGAESQAVVVRDRDDNALVLRIAPSQDGFCMDQFAARRFGGSLPIPDVVRMGKFDEQSYFCLTKWAEGEQSNKLALDDLNGALPNIHKVLAGTFKVDISFTSGYGRAVLPEGNAPHKSWKAFLSENIAMNVESYRKHAINIKIQPSIVDGLVTQYERYLTHASEFRCLLHGDPAHDNMLIKDGRVTAVIDWTWLGYGDWMSDFATISFWSPEAYRDPLLFAQEFDLDAANISERTALYWAINGLRAIQSADKHKSKAASRWLHDHLEQGLLGVGGGTAGNGVLA